LRLDPPHLGKLDIQIQVQDDRAVIHITTQHAQTRDMIDNAGVRLREFLQESGYSSVDVNVSHREQSMAGEDGRQQADSTSMEDAGRLDRAASGDEMRMDASLLADYLPSRGVIDFFA
jgi:flagellar hook-length control protein FliK